MAHHVVMRRYSALVALVFLAACGGGGSSGSEVSVPAAAQGPSQSGMSVQTDALSTLSTARADAPAAAIASSTLLRANQTQGFGADDLLTFTYQEQFDCVDQPFEDRNYNGVVAAEDPTEFYSPPTCQIGAPSTIDPVGKPVATTDKLFVLVPFFETNRKEPAFTEQLGDQLRKLFGFVPDAFKIHPGVPVQCPEPGPPITPFIGKPGTCTMHPLQQDLGPVLAALHLIPPKTILNVPLVNHSHLLDNAQINQAPEWWQIIVVLVKDRREWPGPSDDRGITSVAKLRLAQARHIASPDVPSNFFLFFSSRVMEHTSAH